MNVGLEQVTYVHKDKNVSIMLLIACFISAFSKSKGYPL